MYGKLKERKLRETDFILSCEEARKELDEYIDIQNRRVNVDSAKKLAVIQHMDYEGFRQMVLGANIFSTKSKELNNFSKGEQTNNLVPNKLFQQKKSQKSQPQKGIVEEIQGNSQNHCLNFRDFKKKFGKSYDKELSRQRAQQCYTLIKEQNRARLQKIFNLQCEADILLKIVQVFTFVLDFLKSQERMADIQTECGFMVKYFQIVLSIQTMQDISLNILTKKQREKIVLFLGGCQKILTEQEELEIIGRVIALIKK